MEFIIIRDAAAGRQRGGDIPGTAKNFYELTQ